MERLNLTLERDLFKELSRLAKIERIAVAGLARRLLQEALANRRRQGLRQRMTASYSAAPDPEELATLREMQVLQDELLQKDDP